HSGSRKFFQPWPLDGAEGARLDSEITFRPLAPELKGEIGGRRLRKDPTNAAKGGNMCCLFASQSPDSYAFETRSIRLNGQSTSIRLEKVFWEIIEEIAAGEGLSVPRFISTLHREVLLLWGEVPNFTSHLRCICVVAIETQRVQRVQRGRKRAEAA